MTPSEFAPLDDATSTGEGAALPARGRAVETPRETARAARFLPAALAGLAGLLVPAPAGAQPSISEFQAINNTSLEDEDGDTSDWIEIYNPGPGDLNLDGWYLTDDPDNLIQWSFPPVTVDAGEYVVVFASGKDKHKPVPILRPTPILTTHTNFRLTGDGEYLALVEPDGETVASAFAPVYPVQAADLSYGRHGGADRYFSNPSPGAENDPAGAVGPIILGVTDAFETQPRVGDPPLVVTAEILAADSPIASVLLESRVNYANTVAGVMRDDGTGPDAVADDGVYTGTISLGGLLGSRVDPGDMVRWRVVAEDDAGSSSRSPAYRDPRESPEYYGTVIYDPSIETSNLPVLHWFIQNPNGANTDSGTRCSLYFHGQFYDNVQVDIHGQSTRSFPKKSHDFDFNTGDRFRYAPGSPRVKDIDILSNWADKSKVRNTLSYEFYEIARAHGHFAFPVRVQQNGAFFSTTDMVEDGDDRYLERVGLPADGALYKMYNRLDSVGGGEKKTRKHEGTDDLQELINGISQGSFADKVDYIYDNISVPAVVNYLASNVIIRNSDFGHKNYYVYRDTEGTGEWRILPWDVDLAHGRVWNSADNYFDDRIFVEGNISNHAGNRLVNIFWNSSHREFQDMFYRRLRTLLDEVIQPVDTPVEDRYFERRLDEMLALIDPPGVESDADLDYAKWGSWRNQNNMAQAVERIRNEYIHQRRTYLYSLPELPSAQGTPSVQFAEIDFRPASGDQEQEYLVVQNRSGRLTDISGWRVGGAVDYTFEGGTILRPGGLLIPNGGKLYLAKNPRAWRARAESPKGGERHLVQGPYSGRLSARGETLQLFDAAGELKAEMTFAGDPSPAQEHLRVTELMFAPAAAPEGSGFLTSDFEFIELHNTGEGPLGLEGVAFVDGVDFAFPAGVEIAGGGYLVLAANPAAFASRYGDGIEVAGPFVGKLNNGGENIRLTDAQGEHVLDFDYNDRWYPPARDEGRSIVVREPAATLFSDWDREASWSPSTAVGGSPGAADPPPGGGAVFATWLEDVFDPAERDDPAVSGPLADPDGDGLPNFVEYALGLDPKAPAPRAHRPAVALEGDPGARSLTLAFRRRAAADDLRYTVEVTDDLAGEWTPAAVQPGEGDGVDNGDGTETVTVREDVPAGRSARFIRLRIGPPLD